MTFKSGCYLTHFHYHKKHSTSGTFTAQWDRYQYNAPMPAPWHATTYSSQTVQLRTLFLHDTRNLEADVEDRERLASQQEWHMHHWLQKKIWPNHGCIWCPCHTVKTRHSMMADEHAVLVAYMLPVMIRDISVFATDLGQKTKKHLQTNAHILESEPNTPIWSSAAKSIIKANDQPTQAENHKQGTRWRSIANKIQGSGSNNYLVRNSIGL